MAHRGLNVRGGPPPRRLLFPAAPSDLRLTWHADRGLFTFSLWRHDTCVGSASLDPAESAEIAAFIVGHLGERASWGPRLLPDPPGSAPRPSWWSRLRDRTRR